MEKNYKHLLQDRLTYYLDWKADWQDWFKQQEINEKARRKFYEDKKLFSFDPINTGLTFPLFDNSTPIKDE